MQLYAGSSRQFIEDAVQNQVAEKLRLAFVDYYRHSPSPGEITSWRNSLSKIKDVFQKAELLDHGVVLEYQLPLSSKRLDCMITGKESPTQDGAVIVELKQWDKCDPADGDNEVTTWVGQGNRTVLHPAVQVGQYEMYLKDTHTAFYEEPGPIQLHSCSYLHNYYFKPNDTLLLPKYREATKQCPLFSADNVDSLCEYLTTHVGKGDGLSVLGRVQNSKFRASKKLLEHVGSMIKSKREYVLIDEQLVVYDEVFAAARKGFSDKRKAVLLIRGGPGTGKSVIALNLMADLSLKGFNCHYATGSRAFTTTLRKITGTRAGVQFKYFNSYAAATPNELDVLIMDESHRIRETSVSRFTPKDQRSGKPQLEELLNAAKVCVFFIDDYQVVRPGEIGNSALVKQAAQRLECDIKEYQLEVQFRCSGSDSFVSWINNTLAIEKTAHILWKPEERFEFKIFDSPHELENAIRHKVAEGHTGRVTAGFCWNWSDPKPDGTLDNDVVIGDYKRPWDAKEEAKKLAKGIPRSSLWAYDPNGINQVGCVYTAQGFEFDYAGVIIGKDLIYNAATAEWEGHPENSADPVVKRAKGKFVDLIKNTYRVLLSRGLKGCYVYFMDEDTKNFFLSRIEGQVLAEHAATQAAAPARSLRDLLILPDIALVERFMTHLPVFSLAAAASGFSESQEVRPLGWAPAPIGHALNKDMFIARVKGRSMEPTIPDGSYCVFRFERGGSRNGKVVLVQSRHLDDPESGGQYTVKRYFSEKDLSEDGTWRHKKITLSPDNKEFKDILLEDVDPTGFRVIAEFVTCLG
jgi:DUF2075 family protein